MLVYEKKVDSTRKLFGTEGNIPAVSDSALVYKDDIGETLTIVSGDTYLDDGHGGIIRKSDGKKAKHRQLELAHKWQSVDSDVYNNQRNVRTLQTQKRQQSPVYPGERKKSNHPCG